MKKVSKYLISIFAVFGVFLMTSVVVGQPIAIQRTQVDILEKDNNSDLQSLINKIKKDFEIQNLIERLSKKDFASYYKTALLNAQSSEGIWSLILQFQNAIKVQPEFKQICGIIIAKNYDVVAQEQITVQYEEKLATDSSNDLERSLVKVVDDENITPFGLTWLQIILIMLVVVIGVPIVIFFVPPPFKLPSISILIAIIIEIVDNPK